MEDLWFAFLIYALLMIFQFHPAISTIHAMLKLVHIRRRDCRAMPRNRNVSLSHCGNAISRMRSPFGWVRKGVLTRRETPRQGIRCLLPPNQIFPAAKCEIQKNIIPESYEDDAYADIIQP
jgi:hypothetical protein